MATSKAVKIYGRTYNIKSDSASVSAADVAAYVDSKMTELSGARGRTSTMDLAVLTALNIAQDLLESQGENNGCDQETLDKLDRLVLEGEKELENIRSRRSAQAESP
jgi:cell division protein ZapA